MPNNTNTWIIINSGASGTGNGTLGYTVNANPSGISRTGLVFLGTQVLTISQAGADYDLCSSPGQPLAWGRGGERFVWRDHPGRLFLVRGQ